MKNEPLMSSNDAHQYLLVHFFSDLSQQSVHSIKLFQKDQVDAQTYDQWHDDDTVLVEELTARRLTERLLDLKKLSDMVGSDVGYSLTRPECSSYKSTGTTGT